MRSAAFGALAVLLAGCLHLGDPGRPIPVERIAAPQPARRVVVVLPGRGDDLAALRRAGIAQAIQRAWPDADVVLTGLALRYYIEGRAPERLEAEVLAPLRADDDRELWLLGASMGALGALLHDRAYPDSVDGIVLLAPYLGERGLLREIEAAGGVARWDAGAVPPALDAGNVTRELWRHLQGWQRNPATARRAWLAYGDRDRLRDAIPVFAPLLPATQVLEVRGGHAWRVWTPAAERLLERIEASRGGEAVR